MRWAIERYDQEAMTSARDAVAIDEPWALLERFSTLVRDSGSEHEREAAEYMRERLEALGLQPEVYLPDLYISVPQSCALRVTGDDPAEFDCKVPAFSLSTGDAPVAGELVEIATGEIKDMANLFRSSVAGDLSHVAGKVVLADGYAMPKVVAQLESAGAAAAIFVNPGNSHEGIITPVWGTPGIDDRDRLPAIVALQVSAATGAALRERLANSGCNVEIETELFEGWAPCPVVVVDIPGQTDDFVLLHGHYDSWHEGIGDNAVGDAALLEVARVLGGVRDRLHRGVRVAWWPAHSTGRYGGSTWFADEFAMELRDHCVAQIDVDSPGCRWATEYTQVMWMAEAEEIARESIRAGADAEAAGMRPLRAGDYSFNQIGLSSFFMLLSNIPADVVAQKGFYPVGGCGGNSNAWHTEGDTLDVADPDNLLRDIHVYMEAVVRLATAPFLPFDHRAAVHEIGAAATEYGEACDDALDMTPILEECASLIVDLEDFYDMVEATLKETADAHAAAADFDWVQMALSRELVPVNYARRRYYHDPALETPAVPDLAILRQWADMEDDPDGRGFLVAQALRGRNRVVDALKRARERVAGALPAE
ncbi:MAG: M28 family peptidase [Acidobacteria bacterium]|nr:M28 family peptidase [Acidobacteriota bacterium]